MVIKGRFNVLCENKEESIKVQNFLFSIGYMWCGVSKMDTPYLIPHGKFPIFIRNYSKYDIYDNLDKIIKFESKKAIDDISLLNSTVYEFNQFMRKYKLRILNGL